MKHDKAKIKSEDLRTKKRTPYAHAFRLSHWILAAGMLFLIFTGAGIHSISRPSWSLFEQYPSFYPALRTIYWHKLAGIVFAPASIVAFLFFLPRIRSWNAYGLRKITNVVLIVSGVVCTITSVGLVYSNIPGPLYLTCRFVHALSGMLVAPVFLLLHLALSLSKYLRLVVPSFAPFRQGRWMHAGLLLIGFALSWLLFTRFPPSYFGSNVLAAKRIESDAYQADQLLLLPWKDAGSLNIQLTNGVGFRSGMTRAVLSALHNGRHLYLRIRWEDPVYNRLYRPWIKTDEGWMYLNPGGSDEKIYNEDKMALLFPIRESAGFERFGCSLYCHNNENNRFGIHWTPPDGMTDVWHWKSVRTDPMGHADDKYWLGAGEISADSQGRHGDPGDGGYAGNMVEGVANPMMLPTGIDSIRMGALLLSEARIYTKAAAEKLPAGTAVPGTVVSEASGDRADIRCRSVYQEGFWTVYLVRELDTGSEYDVQFEAGKEYDFAMAAFDHSSFRHAYNHQTYRLVIEK